MKLKFGLSIKCWCSKKIGSKGTPGTPGTMDPLQWMHLPGANLCRRGTIDGPAIWLATLKVYCADENKHDINMKYKYISIKMYKVCTVCTMSYSVLLFVLLCPYWRMAPAAGLLDAWMERMMLWKAISRQDIANDRGSSSVHENGYDHWRRWMIIQWFPGGGWS